MPLDNTFLEAYILGRRERRQTEQDEFNRKVQTEHQKRLEQQRKDTVKRFEDQLKYQRERLAFDREKETADSKYRELQGKALELNMKKIGFELLASGKMEGLIDSVDPATANRGLDELYNTSQGNRLGTQATMFGSGIDPLALAMAPRTSVVPYQKQDIEIAPGISLGKKWQFPWEAGEAKKQVEGPLELMKQEGRERAGVVNLLRAIEIQKAAAGYREEADKRTQARQEARDEAQFTRQKQLEEIRVENEERLAKFREGLKKGGGGPTRQNKIASLNALMQDLKYVLEMGEKTKWSAQNWWNRFPFVEEVQAMVGTDTPDERRYKIALNRLTGEQLNQIYGAVLSHGEMGMARGFIAQTWLNKDVAKDRILDFMRQTANRLKYLQSGGKLEEEGGTGLEGWMDVPGSGKLGGPGILNKPPEPAKPLVRPLTDEEKLVEKFKKK